MVWFLLFLYQVKHFVADYPLQGKYMLGKFKPYPDFILPLLAHTLVHGLFTFLIAIWFKSPLVALAIGLFDMGTHFLVDRVKASPELLGRFKAITKKDYEEHFKMRENLMKSVSMPMSTDHMDISVNALDKMDLDWEKTMKSNTFFWWSLGADQMAHHLTHYIIIWMLLL